MSVGWGKWLERESVGGAKVKRDADQEPEQQIGG